MVQAAPETVEIQGVKLEVIDRGIGQTLLWLHGGAGLKPALPAIDHLAQQFHIIAPAHPGFEHSERPPFIDTVDDLAYLYLDFLDQQNLNDVVVLGQSIGGWIAAEIAIKCCHRLSKVILVDSVGIKFSDRETRDIADIYGLRPDRIAELTFHNPKLGRQDFSQLSDDELTVIARNRESLALYGWQPYMHDPKLRQRLHRITVPTLLIWGESDGLVTQEYGAAFRDAIPGARLEVIQEAGHLPMLEQTEDFVKRVVGFIS